MNHDELRELMDAYVLGALSEDERSAYETHLMTCAECARDVHELMRVTQALGQLVEQREPPADLRRRVLEAATRPATMVPAKPATRWEVTVPAWVAAAAVIAVVAAGLYAASVSGNSARLHATLQQAYSRIAGAERELADLREVAGAAERARMILLAADMSQVELRGQSVAPNARGRALWSDSAGLLFTATDLPRLPPGKTYQLWVVTKSKPQSVGLVSPDAEGRVSLAAEMPPGTQPDRFALTMEPAGGVPAPTGSMFLVGGI